MEQSKLPEWQGEHDAHALAIGRVVIAWNEFQEHLSWLFAQISSPDDYQLPLAAWHALDNDRAQREMLRAVAVSKFPKGSKARTEIVWLIEQANQQLSNQRNFGIHTPFEVHTELGQKPVVRATRSGNRRAQAMRDKDALKEFAIYEEQIREMTAFATGLEFVLSPNHVGVIPWPDRPQLQLHVQSRTPKE
jgi:hypothetical protein